MTDTRSPTVALADGTPLPAVEAQAPTEEIAAVPATGGSLPAGIWATREALAVPTNHTAASVAAMLAMPTMTEYVPPPVEAAASYDQAAALAAASAAYELRRTEARHPVEEPAAVTEDAVAAEQAVEEKAAEDKAAADRAAADQAAEDQKAADDKAAADAAHHDAPATLAAVEAMPAALPGDPPIPTVADAHPVAADDHATTHPDTPTDHAPAREHDD